MAVITPRYQCNLILARERAHCCQFNVAASSISVNQLVSTSVCVSDRISDRNMAENMDPPPLFENVDIEKSEANDEELFVSAMQVSLRLHGRRTCSYH